jgi:hypothetical protein
MTLLIINEFHHLTSNIHCVNWNKNFVTSRKQIFVCALNFPKQTKQQQEVLTHQNIGASKFARYHTEFIRAMNSLTASMHLM